MEKDGHFLLNTIELSAHSIQHSHALGFSLLFQQNHQQLPLPLWNVWPYSFRPSSYCRFGVNRQPIDPFYFPNKQFSIITKPLSYNKFVRNNYKKLTSKVSASEHVAFLWFSSTPLSSAPCPSKFKKFFYPWPS